MDVKDSISVTLKTIDGKETKDQSAKNIFSYKPIMSNILKYTVEEYRDCSLEEIMNCIEGDTIQTGTEHFWGLTLWSTTKKDKAELKDL